jgi:hypothetical protein
VFAQCEGISKTTVGNPSGIQYIEGDTLPYVFDFFVVPGNTCPLSNITVSWWNPDVTPVDDNNLCGDTTDSTVVYNGGIVLEPGGDELTLACDCNDSTNPLCIEVPDLCYTVADADAIAGQLLAYFCVEHITEFPGNPLVGSSEDVIPNTLTIPDVAVSKDCLNPGGLPQGVPADFTVVVTNTGETDLSCVAAELNGGAPILLASGEDFSDTVPVSTDDACLETPFEVSNEVTVICSVPDAQTPTTVQDSASDTCPVPCDPCIDVEKECAEVEPILEGESADFNIVITNCGDIPLSDIVITDPAVGPVAPYVGPLDPGDSTAPILVTIQASVCEAATPTTSSDLEVSNTVTVDAGGETATDSAVCPCDEEETGGEGCTPGFWKIKSNGKPPCWCDTYIGNPLLTAVYDEAALAAIPHVNGRKEKNSAGFAAETLDNALDFKGGGDLEGAIRKLLRHGTAALLNACTLNGGSNYPVGASSIISDINEAILSQDIETIDNLKNTYGNWNECLPCTMNANCMDIDPEDAEEPETQCFDRLPE